MVSKDWLCTLPCLWWCPTEHWIGKMKWKIISLLAQQPKPQHRFCVSRSFSSFGWIWAHVFIQSNQPLIKYFLKIRPMWGLMTTNCQKRICSVVWSLVRKPGCGSTAVCSGLQLPRGSVWRGLSACTQSGYAAIGSVQSALRQILCCVGSWYSFCVLRTFPTEVLPS